MNVYIDFIGRMEDKYQLRDGVLTKLIRVESSGDIDAISPKGAIGLTQLMPRTASDLGVNPNDPFQNIEGGAKYLRQQLDNFNGSYGQALAAYNAGPNNRGVKNRDWERLPGETKSYLEKFIDFIIPSAQAEEVRPNKIVDEDDGEWEGKIVDDIEPIEQQWEGKIVDEPEIQLTPQEEVAQYVEGQELDRSLLDRLGDILSTGPDEWYREVDEPLEERLNVVAGAPLAVMTAGAGPAVVKGATVAIKKAATSKEILSTLIGVGSGAALDSVLTGLGVGFLARSGIKNTVKHFVKRYERASKKEREKIVKEFEKVMNKAKTDEMVDNARKIEVHKTIPKDIRRP